MEAAVIANVDDDTPRLVYADWLDENGDPDRASFIRTQCGLWEKNPSDPDYIDVLERQAEASAQVLNYVSLPRLQPKISEERASFGDVGLPNPDDPCAQLQRGFPYFVREPSQVDRTNFECAHHFHDVLPELFRSTTVRGLYVRDVRNESIQVQFSPVP